MNYETEIKLRNLYCKIERRLPCINLFRLLWLKATHKKPKRYDYLTKFIKWHNCKTILEVGVWNGRHAVEMIKAAKSPVTYLGFDIFEDIDPALAKESSTKIPLSLEVVRKKLETTGADILLYKGYTQQTLKDFCFNWYKPLDFVFIDGGHSLEVIESDWNNIKKIIDKDTIVIFDDYWNITTAGCKSLIDNLDRNKYDIQVLPVVDKFKKDWGTLEIRFAKVRMR